STLPTHGALPRGARGVWDGLAHGPCHRHSLGAVIGRSRNARERGADQPTLCPHIAGPCINQPTHPSIHSSPTMTHRYTLTQRLCAQADHELQELLETGPQHAHIVQFFEQFNTPPLYNSRMEEKAIVFVYLFAPTSTLGLIT